MALPARSAALRDRFLHVRQVTAQLAKPLSEEDCALQSMPDASPVKWHLAHTTWFFETFVLEPFAEGFEPFDPAFRVLFNSYYNAVGNKHPRPERGLISRPDLSTVLAYREAITRAVATLLGTLHGNDGILDLIELGCHHEEQHQELILTDLKHLLSKNPLKPAYQKRWPLTPVEARRTRWLHCAGGLIDIGHAGERFAFDNESPRHKVWLEPFELASHPVTHGEFARFVEDGGYRKPELWLSLGWDWVQANRIDAPMYWQRVGGAWHTFTLHGMIEIDANTPVCHINYFEADAYARWAGARLPTEAEWEHAAGKIPHNGNFLESGALHPLALTEETAAEQPAQLFGDVWEWTASAYLPYPGFKAAPGAVGEYNGKFMCNQFVLRGGSCATPAAHIRASYRNFFPPDARWQFSGFRLARDIAQ
ncbi:MAG: ergothioneine biosynthesis protein EgtB [Betaproteobacteria bacterium]|nr:ergothioneine biosynthesis protein EgtB [Betaproteobacteria bacterium]